MSSSIPANRTAVPQMPQLRADTVALTPEGRARLDERLCALRDTDLRHLRSLLSAPDRDERDVAEFERVYSEVLSLENMLGTSVTLAPTDGTQVHLGTRVLLEMPDGELTWVRPVHPVEASLDDERISYDSPVSRAILGAGRGDSITVDSPSGTWTCRILDVRSVEEGLVAVTPQ
jgi:transcription elongation factor GreA